MAKKKKRLEKKVTIGGKRISVYGFTALEIQQKIEKLKAEEERSSNPLFGDVVDMWAEEHEKDIEYYTADCYKAPVKDVKKQFGDVPITEITAIDIQNFIKSFSALGYKRQTVKLRLSVIKQVFDYAILNAYVQFNPAAVVTIPRNVKHGSRSLPDEKDIASVKKHKSDYFGLFPYFVMYTGMRKEEALAVQWTDIDFNKNVIRVNKVIVFEYGKPILRHHTKSEAGNRTIPLLQPLKEELLLYKKDNGFVFSKPDGSMLSKGSFDYAFKHYRELYNINCTVHQLRHEFATLCFDAALDVKDTQIIMGHSKESVTRDIYTHIRNSRRKTTAEKLNKFVTDISVS